MNDQYKLKSTTRIFSLLIIVLLLSCQKKQNIILEEATEDNYDTEILNELFGVVDSIKIKESIGCANGIYGLLNDEYVIKLPSNVFTPYNENITSYELGNNLEQVELIFFAKDSSHITNYCTDIHIVNFPEPKRIIKSTSGKLKSVTLYENHDYWFSKYCAYIKIDNIKFIDEFNNNQEIIIKDIILWEVYDFGVPG